MNKNINDIISEMTLDDAIDWFVGPKYRARVIELDARIAALGAATENEHLKSEVLRKRIAELEAELERLKLSNTKDGL